MRLQSTIEQLDVACLYSHSANETGEDTAAHLPQASAAFTETTSKGTGGELPAPKRAPQPSRLREAPGEAAPYSTDL